MFNLPKQKRLGAWRQFRSSIETLSTEQQTQAVAALWARAPQVFQDIDYSSPESWPTPWELIIQDDYGPFGLALGMSYTLGLLDNTAAKQIRLRCYKDSAQHNFLFLVWYDDYILNWSTGCISRIQDISKTAQIQFDYDYIALKLNKY